MREKFSHQHIYQNRGSKQTKRKWMRPLTGARGSQEEGKEREPGEEDARGRAAHTEERGVGAPSERTGRWRPPVRGPKNAGMKGTAVPAPKKRKIKDKKSASFAL